MKTAKSIITVLLLLMMISASAQQQNANEASLHLMQPDYGFPYGVPTADASQDERLRRPLLPDRTEVKERRV